MSNDKKKLYRVVTRIRGTHPDFPYVHVDMSVVRTSNSNKRGNLIPTFNIKDTNIFTNQEQYEIEIEYTKALVKSGVNRYTWFRLHLDKMSKQSMPLQSTRQY